MKIKSYVAFFSRCLSPPDGRSNGSLKVRVRGEKMLAGAVASLRVALRIRFFRVSRSTYVCTHEWDIFVLSRNAARSKLRSYRPLCCLKSKNLYLLINRYTHGNIFSSLSLLQTKYMHWSSVAEHQREKQTGKVNISRKKNYPKHLGCNINSLLSKRNISTNEMDSSRSMCRTFTHW